MTHINHILNDYFHPIDLWNRNKSRYQIASVAIFVSYLTIVLPIILGISLFISNSCLKNKVQTTNLPGPIQKTNRIVASQWNETPPLSHQSTVQAEPLPPPYPLSFVNDPSISLKCKELFKIIFIDIFNPDNLAKGLPLGNLVGEDSEIKKQFDLYNAKHFNNDRMKYLSCRGSAHSSSRSDPWQTIKIIAPQIIKEGETSDLLLELKRGLDKHYHLKSGGGGDWQEWMNRSFDDKMKLNKYDPICFLANGNVMNPQLMLTLIDIKKIIGIIPTDEDYIKALSNAYYSNKNYNGDQYANPAIN